MNNSNKNGPTVEDLIRDSMSVVQRFQNVYLNKDTLQALLLAAEKVAPVMKNMQLWEWVEQTYVQSGFLPYRTVPFAEYYDKSSGKFDLFCPLVSRYYEENQQEILQDIESRLTVLPISEEPKATLREAIKGHNHSLFRLSCRGLLPDIERVILQEWLGREGVASLTQKSLEKAVEQKYLEDFAPENMLDLVLFKRLVNHLYRNGKHFNDIKNETVPNRPAALHGWLSYSSETNSLNTIILADYVFRLSTHFNQSQD